MGSGGETPAGGRAPGAGGSAAATGGAATEEAGMGGVGETAGGPAAGGPGVVAPGPCGFHVDVARSPQIATVVTVEWSVALSVVESAEIDFGLDPSYGLVAPVDLDEPSYRTLLLGMKPSRDYHVRVVVRGDGRDCTSEDFVVSTGPVGSGLPDVTLTTVDKARAAGGYLVSSFLAKGPAFILDADGEYVWWSRAMGLGRAQLSYDGKYMWYGNVNVRGGAGVMGSVRMDGSDDTKRTEFGDCHHDFTVLPDGAIGFIQHDGDDCDRIMERAADGSVREVVNVRDAYGGGVGRCHTNSIHYHPGDDSYTFSDLNQNAYAKVKRTGEVVWVLGGSTSDFTGDGASWTRQHGHDLLAPDRLLFFTNGALGDSATAVEVSLDFEQMIATRVWSYAGTGHTSAIYGDVQRLDNGNTLVTYSGTGIVEEVTPEGELVETTRFDVGSGIGYVSKRASLYGPPPMH